jgi:hypothetical protein
MIPIIFLSFIFLVVVFAVILRVMKWVRPYSRVTKKMNTISKYLGLFILFFLVGNSLWIWIEAISRFGWEWIFAGHIH